jgi:DNA-directed RNA polymerase subunit RPC12/RpoP
LAEKINIIIWGKRPLMNPPKDKKREKTLQKEKGQGCFRCCHCGREVSFSKDIGTAHRNHCPFCLWSKHVDEKKPGDRQAQCQSGMKPIGLAFKQAGKDKYGRPRQGEIMLIHKCTGCGKISLNRIAADDNEKEILKVFEESQNLSQRQKNQLQEQGIQIISSQEKSKILIQLFGKDSQTLI